MLCALSLQQAKHAWCLALWTSNLRTLRCRSIGAQLRRRHPHGTRPPSVIWSRRSSTCTGTAASTELPCAAARRARRQHPHRRIVPGHKANEPSSCRAESSTARSGTGEAPETPSSPVPAEAFSALLPARQPSRRGAIQPSRGVVGLDLRRDLPWWQRPIDRPSPPQAVPKRHPRRRSAAPAARRPSMPSRSTDKRAGAGIDAEMNAGAVAVLGLAGGDAKRVACAPQHEVTVAAHRAGQRAHVAAEGDVAQFERAAARGIMQGDAAGQVQPVDRQRAQIEFSASMPASRSGPADRDRDRAPCR